MNKLTIIYQGEIDKLSDEWLEYMSEEIPEDWYRHTSENTDDDDDDEEEEDTAQSDHVVKYERIDVYWSKVGKMTRRKKVPSSHETGKNCSHP